MNKKFIQQIDFFSPIPEEKIDLIIESLEARQYQKGELVVKQGDPGDGMYIIIFGEVAVIRNNEAIATLKNEDFFGELSLIAGEPRSASIQVASDSLSTLFFSKESFDKIKENLSDEVRAEMLRRLTENYA